MLAKMENITLFDYISKTQVSDEPSQKTTFCVRGKQKVSNFGYVFFAFSVATILFVNLFLKYDSDISYGVDIATVVDQVNVRWGQSFTSLENGSRLWTGDGLFDLEKGILKIQYDDGVDVFIEGPAVFKVERGGIYMEYGRLYSRVPETGLGFSVQTPTSHFIDHGAEFIVQADTNDSSEVHVIKGKVQLFAGVQGETKYSQMVMENNSIRYDVNCNLIRVIPLKTNFYWRINSVKEFYD